MKKDNIQLIKLSYEGTTDNAQNPKSNITWFNPSYSDSAKSKRSISLIVHSPREHRLHKIGNKNNLNISYSCMDNIEEIHKLTNNNNHYSPDLRCNSCNKDDCPLTGNSQNIKYQAKVMSPDDGKIYIVLGLTPTTLKRSYFLHKNSLNNQEKRYQIELCIYIRKLEDNKTPHSINWKS